MDPLGFLLDLVRAYEEIERVKERGRETILRKYGAELGIEVSGCCGDEKTACCEGADSSRSQLEELRMDVELIKAALAELGLKDWETLRERYGENQQ